MLFFEAFGSTRYFLARSVFQFFYRFPQIGYFPSKPPKFRGKYTLKYRKMLKMKLKNSPHFEGIHTRLDLYSTRRNTTAVCVVRLTVLVYICS